MASSALTYPDVGEWAYGEKFEKFTSACICTQQLAICTVFFSFIGENIYAVCQLMPDVVPSIFLSHVGVFLVMLLFVLRDLCFFVKSIHLANVVWLLFTDGHLMFAFTVHLYSHTMYVFAVSF